MEDCERNDRFRRLVDLWNYALSAGSINIIGYDTHHIHLCVARVAVERLKDEGVEFIGKDPLDTIEAINLFFVEHGYFDDAWVKEGRLSESQSAPPAGTGTYILYSRNSVVYESNSRVLSSGKDNLPSCLWYNFIRYTLIDRFELDLGITHYRLRDESREWFIETRLKKVERTLTERIDLLWRLRNLSREYINLLNISTDAIISTDKAGKIVVLNPSAERMFGYSRGEVIGKELKGFFQEIFRKMGERDMKNLEDGRVRNIISEGTKKNGSGFTGEIALITDRTGGERAFTALVRDISEHKKMEEGLKDSEERYRTIFENTGTATTIVEDDMTISLVNTEFEKLSGYSKEEVEGKMRWTEFVAGEDLQRMLEYHRRRRIDPDSAPRNYEFRFLDRNRNVKDIYVTVAVIPGTKRSVASLLDITNMKVLERRLRENLEDVERINKLMVGRELKMEELRREIRELKQRIKELEGGE